MLGAIYPTKKALKESIGQSLQYEEYNANGTFAVVGPSPRKRTWFASVTMKDGKIVKVS